LKLFTGALVARSFEVPGQKVAAEKNQRDRKEANKGYERKRPHELKDQEHAGAQEQQANQRRALYERAFESFFIRRGALSHRNEVRGAIGVNNRIEITGKSRKREQPGSKTNLCELEQSDYRNEMNDTLDVLPVEDCAHAREQRE